MTEKGETLLLQLSITYRPNNSQYNLFNANSACKTLKSLWFQ